MFTDNFDYQTRDDFVRGILVNEEVSALWYFVAKVIGEHFGVTKLSEVQSEVKPKPIVTCSAHAYSIAWCVKHVSFFLQVLIGS